MRKEEVFLFLKSKCNKSGYYSKEFGFKKTFPEIYQELSTWTFPSDFKFTQKLYHYFMNDPELKLGLCPVCGNRCKFVRCTYTLYCSSICKNKDIKHIQEKREKTCLDKFGYKTSFMNEDVKIKIKNTLMERYGVEHALQSDKFKENTIKTCQEKYGVDYYMQTDEYKNRYIKTCQEKYGTNNAFQNESIKEKIKNTNIQKYGVEHYTKTKECLKKMQETCIEKYGVVNYSQTKDWSHKKKKRINYDGIYFDSSWEVIVYKYCKKNNLNCIYQPNILINYTYNKSTHTYHPDFLINGKLYEVKGEQFFEGDKMISPYNRNQYNDELAEAKHQCMIENNVIILRYNDIKKMKENL